MSIPTTIGTDTSRTKRIVGMVVVPPLRHAEKAHPGDHRCAKKS